MKKMEQDIKEKLKLLIIVSKVIYPKYDPFWFIIYMYLIYFRIAKRKKKYKIVSIPSQSILSYSEIRKYFDDINNIAIVNDQNLYKYDKLLQLFHADNSYFRNVYVVPCLECKETELLVSECLYYNLTNVGLVDSLELGNFNEKLVKFADEINISVVSSPFDINNSLFDTILEKYFKTPKLVNTGDMIAIDVKYYAQDLFYISNKINNIDKVYFKCNKVLFGNSEVNYNCFCAIGETAIRQSTNVQSFIPKQLSKIVSGRSKNFDTELSLCPYGLQEYMHNIQKAVKPFLNKRRLNLDPVFLVQGNAGSGKEILLSSLASFLGMHFYMINNSNLIANVYAQNEAKLRNLFFTGKMAAPCVIALLNFENYGKNNDGHYDERLMSNFGDELAILFDNNPYPICLFCCTSQNIPPELKKLFLQTFDISALTDIQREQNLKWIIEEKGIKTSANLFNIANKTHGFLYEDLRALVYYAEEDFKRIAIQHDVVITEENFTNAVEYMQGNYNESIGAPKVPKVQWSDVGGLDDVKEEIIKTINLPLKYPEFLKKSGLKRSGILLFGPPGTGKTLIAKAVATECSLCFLSVKGPELLNMYVGQSEQNIREVFERARQASPCIIFFDELDSVAPNRGMSGDSGGVMDRVVSQLLAEMDGLNESATVFIIAATNRPDLIDPALLRPGRFDKLLYVGACTDANSKTSVLQALTRKFNLSEDVNLTEVVNICPINITGADLYGICSNAWCSAVRRLISQIESDTYEVLFDDGFVKTVKAQRMSKLEVEVNKPGQSSPLFDPIKSSKQDRRDKKRKLNVAALFRKRHKRDSSDEKPAKKHIQPTQENIQQEVKTIEEEEDIQNWRPRWIKSKPVGIEALLETADGPRHTTIVPDPRLPPGWAKHLLRKAQGKWDTIIVSPDNKKFRSKTDIRAYLELHPIEGVNDSMFSFALVGGKRQRKSQGLTPAKKTTPVVTPKKATVDFQESSHNESQILEEQAKVAEVELKEQDNLNSLKILFENDAFKCPIEGCGKTFRRENLAQMHVKHYHPEYTKFLDSTPNVADLAYARTVGENLDKSPGPSKTPALKPLIRTSTPKISKSSQSPIHDTTDSKPVVKVHSPTPAKTKDAEIIKLLSTKPFDKKDSEPIQPLPSGLPTSMYPDIKLKDLLNKAEGMPKRDDLNLKTLCMTRPPAGIKTLLPVVRQPPSDTSTVIPPSSTTFETSRHSSSYKRKRGFSENPDTTKGKDRSSTNLLEPNQSQLTPKQQTPLPSHHKTLIPLSASLPPQPPPQLVEGATSNVPSLPPNNIIIEGGEVIKIVRMKQEEIINCTCGYTEEDGLMIQCELCLCWQHAYCNNIERESQVPEKYVCYICQNPVRERASRKYYHDQDWLRQGALPTGTYHCRDDEALQKRFEKLKTCHDLSGALLELRQYMHSLAVKLKIAEAKNHPKLYLWSKPWEKNQLPEKPKQEKTEIKPKAEPEECFVKNEENIDKEEKQESDSMLMMILKAGKEQVMPKLDLNTLMADNNEPIIPRPEAAIDSADCKLNLLEHIVHQESLVDQRLDDFEKQIEALEEGLNIETEPDYPRTRHTVQLLMRDLDKLRDFSYSTTI